MARPARLSNRYKRLPVKRWHRFIKVVECPRLIRTLFALFTVMESPLLCRPWEFTRPLDGARDVFGDRGSELNELTSRAFERKAMLVFPARRVRSQCWNADAVFALDGLRVPCAGRAVCFRRDPSLDVPAIYRRILWFHSQFDALSQQSAVFVAILKLSANPRKAVPAPHGTMVRFPTTIHRACGVKAQRPG